MTVDIHKWALLSVYSSVFSLASSNQIRPPFLSFSNTCLDFTCWPLGAWRPQLTHQFSCWDRAQCIFMSQSLTLSANSNYQTSFKLLLHFLFIVLTWVMFAVPNNSRSLFIFKHCSKVVQVYDLSSKSCLFKTWHFLICKMSPIHSLQFWLFWSDIKEK